RRVLLRGVRLPRLDARLFRRPRRPRRRFPEGGERPGAPVRRHRALLSPGLLPAADRPGGLAAGVLARERSRAIADGPRPRRGRLAAPSLGPRLRRPARVPGLGGPGRPRTAPAARRGAARERPAEALDDRSPV